MKKLLGGIGVVALVIVAVPVVYYRSVSPCEMLRREIVRQAREHTGAMTSRGRAEAERHGDEVAGVVDGIGAAIEGAAAELAEGAATLATRNMSWRACVDELIDIKWRR